MLNKIVAKTHQIQIRNSNFWQETNLRKFFRILWVVTHSRGNKEACPYPAIKSYNSGSQIAYLYIFNVLQEFKIFEFQIHCKNHSDSIWFVERANKNQKTLARGKPKPKTSRVEARSTLRLVCRSCYLYDLSHFQSKGHTPN